MKVTFDDFIKTVDGDHLEFVKEMHVSLLNSGCKLEIKESKKRYIITYSYITHKKRVALLNYVFLKKGMMVRIYARNIRLYQSFMNSLPDDMKQSVMKANHCKRLMGTDACSPTCTANYHFMMDGVIYKKCKMYAFFWKVEMESMEYIKKMLVKELSFIQTDE